MPALASFNAAFAAPILSLGRMSLSLASPAVAAPLRADAVVAFTVLAEVVTPAVDEVTMRGVDEVTTFRTEDDAEVEEDAALLSENLE